MKQNRIIDNIRVVSMEAITNAGSGHPGIALGAAPIVHTLYSSVLKQTAKDSKWMNRDRFILAAGHGSALLYSVLHLSGYNIQIEDLKNLRQLGSKLPGHPEVNWTDGIDATSGPLGQGIPMGLGMAFAERVLANRYNKEKFNVFDHYTYVLCGDGDLQEGVTVEALSLAGHLKLNKLIILYDSNDIQLDGPVSACNTEDVRKKVQAMNFNYLKVENGNDYYDILEKIELAKKSDKPVLIEIKTIIGHGALSQGTNKCHGSPLKIDEVKEMREKIGGNSFEFNEECYEYYQSIRNCNEEDYDRYQDMMKEYQKLYSEDYQELVKLYEGDFSITDEDINIPFNKDYNKATRYVCGEFFNKASHIIPTLIGGSADLMSSSQVTGIEDRHIDFGVREHAMAAICNGITLHGGARGFCSGFFVFSDYLKPAIRMSALMKLPVVYCFSHDSIAVGEDGPTHQPIEQLTMLRSIPNVNVIRPNGLVEAKEACLIALESKETPTVICASRQNMNEVRESDDINLTKFGAYVISKEQNNLDAVIIATGSEVELAINIQKELLNDNIDVRVVSMPSIFLFEKQSDEYKKEVLPNVDTFAIEMSEAAHMYKYIKGNGKLFNINRFGVSGKAKDVIEYFGFTTKNIKEQILECLSKNN